MIGTNQQRGTFFGFAAALGAVLAAGCSGGNGAAGRNGTSCAITDNHDGTATLNCGDGGTFTVKNGTDGTNGNNGTNGMNGMNGMDGTSCTLTGADGGTRTLTCGADGGTITVIDAVADYATMTADEKAQANIAAAMTKVAFPADGRPVVSLKVTERHGLGVKNLSTAAATWRFSLLKLVPGIVGTAGGVNGSASDTWVSYMAPNDHTSTSAETAAAANLTDHGDGNYDYRFAQVVNGGPTTAGTTYEADKTHRLIVLLYASGNPFAPINLIKELVPATGADVTGQHESVDGNACLECHTSFRAISGGTGQFGTGEFHNGVRYDIRACSACHNDQKRFSSAGAPVAEPAIAADGTWTGTAALLNREAVLDLPVFIHKIHMGKKLALTGGSYAGLPQPYETTYPQDVRNCGKCHRAPAPLADHWKTQPSSRACGACHDSRSFEQTPPAARVAHSGGPQATDAGCATCHRLDGPGGDIAAKHSTVSAPNPHNIYADPAGSSNTNAAWVAAAGFVPAGAKVITYDLKSVGLSANRNPQAVFRFMRADPTASPPVAATPITFPGPSAATELVPGFVGSPSVYFVYALPQDSVTAPADFNASASGYIRNIWNGTATGAGAGTLTGPDTSGYYTITLTSVTIPASATMLTGGIGYTYSLGTGPAFSNNTQPFTEIDLPAYPYTPNASGFSGQGGLIVPPHDVSAVASGFSARRAIVDNGKCGVCHVTLGVGPDFHAGQRNDAPTCAFCHRPNLTGGGWTGNAKDFIHSVHGAEKRTVPFSWHAESPTEGFWETTYPGVLNKCEMCHLPGTYDFSLTAAAGAYPNMLYSTVGQGRYNGNAATNPTGYFSISPYVASDNQTDYGYGYSTSNVTATLPTGLGGTQTVGGNVVACTPAAPCACSATSPCSIDVGGPVTVNNIAVNFTQKIGSVTSACNATTPCTCTTAQPCTGTVATCSLTAPCQAQPTTLVNSPIVAACAACHDSATAIDHMQTNGGSFYEPRSIAFSKPQKEECLLCHGPGRVAAIADRHAFLAPGLLP